MVYMYTCRSKVGFTYLIKLIYIFFNEYSSSSSAVLRKWSVGDNLMTVWNGISSVETTVVSIASLTLTLQACVLFQHQTLGLSLIVYGDHTQPPENLAGEEGSTEWQRTSLLQWITGSGSRNEFTTGRIGQHRLRSRRKWRSRSRRSRSFRRRQWFTPWFRSRRSLIIRMFRATSRMCMAGAILRRWFRFTCLGLQWKLIVIWILRSFLSVELGEFTALWGVEDAIVALRFQWGSR